MRLLEELKSVLDNYENGVSYKDEGKLLEFKEKSIVLYGAGTAGKQLFNILNRNDFDILCFLDMNRNIDKSVYEVPVYYPENLDIDKENVVVIISALFSINICSEVKENLMKLGFENIYSLQEINFSSLEDGRFYDFLYDRNQKKEDLDNLDREKIFEAFNLFDNDRDRKIYIDYIRAHLSMDFTKFTDLHDVSMQYLAHDIDVTTNHTRYIDCGGYDGDTVRNLVKNEKHIEKLAVFEPQNDFCEKIYEYAKNQDFKEFSIFPCGVGERAEKLRFNVASEAKSAWKVSESGEEIIQCMSIDSSLHGFKPTFIKMDIEGSEKAALRGAKNTIIESQPQLAICVYHSLADIWNIPLLIKSFGVKYKFYLRAYNYLGLETVLYAFPEVEE